MQGKRFSVGVAGCGVIAGTHLGYLRTIPGVTVTGLCDTDEQRLNRTGERHGVAARFTSLETMLREARPDVVHVLTPPGPAVGLARTALDAGCHVMIEKPMGRTPEEAASLVETAARKGVMLAVDHSRLLHPGIIEARRRLADGDLGELVSVEIVQGFTRAFPVGRPPSGAPIPWSYTYPWGIFHNLIPHCLYYARAFAGEPVETTVRAWTRGHVPESAFDELSVTMDGTRAQARILLTLCSAPERNTVTLRGTRRTIIVDTNLVTEVTVTDRSLPSMVAKNISVLDPAWQLASSSIRNTTNYLLGRIRSYPDIRNTLEAFYGALRGENPLPASGDDGLAVVRLMEDVRLKGEAALGSSGHGRDGSQTGPHRGGTGASRLPADGSGGAGLKIFLTGATGLVGQHVLFRALETGHRVTVMARDLTRLPPRTADRVAVIQGDLSLAGAAREALPGHDVVINCAGVLKAEQSSLFMEGNVEGPRRLYRAAREAGVPAFVHIGSLGVYGVDRNPVVDETTREEPRPELRGGYTASKLRGDHALLEEAAAGPPVLTILRPATVFGQGVRPPLGKLSKRLPGGFVLVGGSASTAFPLTYAGNLADAVLAAARQARGGIYNIADQDDLTQAAYHRALRSIRGPAPRPIFIPAFVLQTMATVYDLLGRLLGRKTSAAYRMERTLASRQVSALRAGRDLGYEPRHSLQDALRLTLGLPRA